MPRSTARLSIFSSFGLALLGTTCCALPALLVLLGAGGAVASLVSAVPWLAQLSAHKAWVFTVTASALGYSWWRLRRVTQCQVADARQLRWQRRVLWAATLLLLLSILMAYAAVPLLQWLELSSDD